MCCFRYRCDNRARTRRRNRLMCLKAYQTPKHCKMFVIFWQDGKWTVITAAKVEPGSAFFAGRACDAAPTAPFRCVMKLCFNTPGSGWTERDLTVSFCSAFVGALPPPVDHWKSVKPSAAMCIVAPACTLHARQTNREPHLKHCSKTPRGTLKSAALTW